MLVKPETFEETIDAIAQAKIIALDTETTGLYAHKGHRLFAVIIATEAQTYYFNFQDYPGISGARGLPRTLLGHFDTILQNPSTVIFMHNAKFDLSMLAAEGLMCLAKVHCTEVAARIIYNAHFDYSLAACAKRIGQTKSSAVDDYIAMHQLYTVEQFPGAKKKTKTPHYDQVPLEVMQPYGELDARITYTLGIWQLKELAEIVKSTESNLAPISQVYENECHLTNVCFKMEWAGIKIDRAYCEDALAHEESRAEDAAAEFTKLSGIQFKDSNKVLAQAFTVANEKYPTTAKGNPSFTDAVLEKFTSPLAQLVRNYRESSKKANTYYRNFLRFADSDDRVHANMRQAGTETGRFSYAEPNLQNLSRDEDRSQPYIVRRAFVPTSSDYCFAMIDYDQMEYRVMLEFARPEALIDKVLGGLDIHQATAEMVGISRTKAKTLNFLLLYGGGPEKMSGMLGITLREAKQLRQKYFDALPKVLAFSRKIIDRADRAQRIVNWFGYQCHYPNLEYTYTAPNHYIQGGCAQIVRRAMVECDKILQGMRSRMLVQIHDELLFEIHKTELDVIPYLKNCMEKPYLGERQRLPLTCAVSHSWQSWADKEKGAPSEETRNNLQRESSEGSADPTEHLVF